MNKYKVFVKVTIVECHEVEAETEDAAMEKWAEEGTYLCNEDDIIESLTLRAEIEEE